MRAGPQAELEEIEIPVRTLSTSSHQDIKAISEVLRANSGRIVDSWAAATSKSAYLRGSELKLSEQMRVDRMSRFLEALIDKASNPDDRKAHQVFKAHVRGEHASAMGFGSLVKKQNLLKDVMLDVVERELPQVNRLTAKMAIDTMVDKAIEGSVIMMDEYGEMRASLVKCMPGSSLTQQSMDQDLSRFCRSVMDYFEAEFVAVFRHDPHLKDLTCLSSSAKGIALTKDTSILLDSFPLAEEAIEQRRARSTDNGRRDRGAKEKAIGRLSFEHSVVSPITKGEEVTGVLLVGDNSRLVPFTSDEVSLIEDLSTQLSWALHSNAIFNQLSVRSKAQKTLIETAAALQQEIESEEIYRIVATRLAEIISCNEFAFYVFDWERRVVNPAYAIGPYASEIMADRDFSVDVGFVGYVSKTRRAEIIWDTEADPRGEYIPGTPKTTTRMLAVPVLGQKDVLGVIELLRYPPAIFTQDEVDIATMFANHASVALENAKLLRELRSAREQIEIHMDLLTHDIANYATPIMAYFESLRGKKDLDGEVSDVLEKTAHQVEGIMQLVEMVRTISRLREGPPKSLQSMDLRKAIKGAVKEFKGHQAGKEIEVALELPSGPMKVIADQMLGELFSSLFYSIALSEHCEKAGISLSAEVRLERKVEFWWVKVAQPSKMIPNNLKGAVLRMSKASRSELASGFGIGLAAARGIVERYSGNMWVSDLVPGDPSKGCVFNMMIPRQR
ncbi:MAG: GAF domain-containing sensor histidine kinase [Candidatus Thermoplasmatota archaeon]|nr:GAF domain-containing sensor histidine kinase [Candidatus Thermoplasmatota archaeon]